MYEESANPFQRSTRRKRLPPWGLFAVLLATSLGAAVQYESRARVDAAVAPKEQHAVGKMVKLIQGRHPTAWYSFAYAGQQYRGKDGISSSHCFCDVAVYFDPQHPSTNSLVEYNRRTWADHSTTVICLWMSAAFAAILVLTLVMRSKKSEPTYPQVS
jgi:hypothetical protein